MNQDKTGKFISKLGKEKKLTQQNLAERLGVSINAVSKWERGLSFPDVSLYKELCKELDISIEELINGEKDNSEEAKEKAIISTIKEKNKIKKNSNKKITILFIAFLCIIVLIILFNENSKINLINGSNYLYDYVIDYLREEEFKNNPESNKKDFNVFYSYHGFGIEKKNNFKYVYMWVFSQSYYLEEENSLAISSGSSMPLKITFKNNKIINLEHPKDGDEYISSINKMFPSIIADQILNYDKENNINKMFNEVSDKKNKYYDYLKLDMSRLTIDDISYDDFIFSIWSREKKSCVPVQLNIYKNNKYTLYTSYKACKPNTACNSMLSYTKYIEGTYDYDIIQIIKHSTDANNMSFTNLSLPKYEITAGNGYPFITDDDNKYLIELLKIINVDLNKCAEPDYVN